MPEPGWCGIEKFKKELRTSDMKWEPSSKGKHKTDDQSNLRLKSCRMRGMWRSMAQVVILFMPGFSPDEKRPLNTT